jgi:hypothetical protein
VRRETRVLTVPLVSLAEMVPMVNKETPDPTVLRALKAPLDPLERTDAPVLTVLPEPAVRKVPLDLRVMLVPRVPLVLRDPEVMLVPRVSPVITVLMDNPDSLVRTVLRELKERTV